MKIPAVYAVDIACNKQLTKLLLEEVAIPVPYGDTGTSFEEILQIVEEVGYPVVVKPKNGNKGKFVFINIKNKDELKHAFLEARNFNGEVIAEEYIEGRDYRLLIVNGNFAGGS